MLSCKQTAKILNQDEDLSLGRRASLRFHLLICHHCRKYAEQLRLLKEGVRKLFRTGADAKDSEVRELEEKVLREMIYKDK